MKPFTKVTSAAIPFYRENIDTDVIIAARHLKTISRLGLGKNCFETIRYDEAGNIRNSSPFDTAPFKGAEILVAGANFGCGSSREHAVWALMDMGVRCIIAPSFADIFFSNALKNGMLLITLSEEDVLSIEAEGKTGKKITVDLAQQEVALSENLKVSFAIDNFRKERLLEGLDEIGMTLKDASKITAFETQDKVLRPWLYR